MISPWWDDRTAATLGAFGGSAIGVFGGILGTVAGIFAPRGKCKLLVYGMEALAAVAGGILLAGGLIALVSRQPYAVWYPLVLSGGILSFTMAWCIPLSRYRYRQAEMRRLDAQQFLRE